MRTSLPAVCRTCPCLAAAAITLFLTPRSGFAADGEAHPRPGDSVVESYLSRRSDASLNVASQIALAEWCRAQRLDDEARAHFLLAARLSDDFDQQAELREAAGDVADGTKWLSPSEVAARDALRESRAQAVALFGGKVSAWRTALEKSADPTVQQEMSLFRAPHAEWLIGREFSDASGRAAFAAIEVLAAQETVAAAAVLAEMAVDGADGYVRRAAARALRDTAADRFVPAWLDRLHTPLRVTRATHTVLRRDAEDITDDQTVWTVTSETRSARKRAWLTTNAEVDFAITPTRRVIVRTGNGRLADRALANLLNVDQGSRTLSFRERSELEQRGQVALDQTTQQQLNRLKRSVAEQNGRVLLALKQSLGPEAPRSQKPRNVWNWWQHKNGLASIGPRADKELIEVSEEETRTLRIPTTEFVSGSSCFVAGTPVWTDRGPLPIEQLDTGDRVLTLDLDRGEQSYAVVLYPTKRFTEGIHDLTLGEANGEVEVVRSSSGHPFWNVLTGWQRVINLQGGELLRTATGTAWLEDVAPVKEGMDSPKPVYNLVVDQTHTYYVGDQKLLVHDDTVPTPREPETAFASPENGIGATP